MFLTGSQAIFTFAQKNLYSIVDSKETSTLHLSNIKGVIDSFKKGENIFSNCLLEYENLQNENISINQELKVLFQKESELAEQLEHKECKEKRAAEIAVQVSQLWSKTVGLKEKVELQNEKTKELYSCFSALQKYLKTLSSDPLPNESPKIRDKNTSTRPGPITALGNQEEVDVITPQTIATEPTYEEILARVFTDKEIAIFEEVEFNPYTDISLLNAFKNSESNLPDFHQIVEPKNENRLNKEEKYQPGSLNLTNGKTALGTFTGSYYLVPKKDAEGRVFLRKITVSFIGEINLRPGEVAFYGAKMENRSMRKWPKNMIITNMTIIPPSLDVELPKLQNSDLPDSGHCYIVPIKVTAPEEKKKYLITFRLSDRENHLGLADRPCFPGRTFFGDRMHVKIEVTE